MPGYGLGGGLDGERYHLMSRHMHCALQAPRGLQVRAAMFDGLSSGLEKAWDLVRKDGKLTKDNVKGPMREIRRALLEADVSPIKPKASCLRVASASLRSYLQEEDTPVTQVELGSNKHQSCIANLPAYQNGAVWCPVWSPGGSVVECACGGRVCWGPQVSRDTAVMPNVIAERVGPEL